jgi:hypothetical protein
VSWLPVSLNQFDSPVVSWVFLFLLSWLLIIPFASRSQVVSINVEPHYFTSLNALDSQATTTLSICTSSLMFSNVFIACNSSMDVHKPTMELCPPSPFACQGYYHKNFKLGRRSSCCKFTTLVSIASWFEVSYSLLLNLHVLIKGYLHLHTIFRHIGLWRMIFWVSLCESF